MFTESSNFWLSSSLGKFEQLSLQNFIYPILFLLICWYCIFKHVKSLDISLISICWLLPVIFQSFCSMFFSCSVVSDALWPHGLQHARLPCPSPSPRACSSLCPSSWWCHSSILSSAVPFSSCLQSFPASGSFLMSRLFASGGQSIGASASASGSVLPINIQGRLPLGLTGLISLQSKGHSIVFSNTTVQKDQFLGSHPSLWSNCHIHTWPLEKT